MTDPTGNPAALARVTRSATAVTPDPDAGPLDLADALWLRQFLPGTARPERVTQPPKEDKGSGTSGTSPPPPPATATTPADVSAIGGGGETRTAGTELRVPVPPAVARTRDLASAVHPLGRRRPSPTRREVDVDETVRRAADAGDRPWDVVERPVADRWLRVAVVADTSASAAVWHATARGLIKMLAESGVFARFRVWFWDTDASLPGVRAARGAGSTHPTTAVLDPGGPQVVLVLTDAAGRQWQLPSQPASRVLATWASAAHVAVVQMLPERLWGQTGLSAADLVAVAGVGLAPRNSKLSTAKPAPAGPRFPVFALDARSIGRWAGLVAASPQGLVPAYVFSPHRTPRVTWTLPTSSTAGRSAEVALDAFWAAASPTARRLAGLLAASAPYVSLPVLRLVSRALVPDATNLHEAEVLTGGLLEETAKPLDGDPEKLVFQFAPGVRDLLADGVPVDVAARGRSEVAAKIDELSAAGAATTGAAVPEAGGRAEVIAGRTILKVDADLLHRLRGAPATPRPKGPQRPPDPEWPTLDEVSRVPRWALLALLTRLVRRLRPLVLEGLNTQSAAVREAFDTCLVAERVASAPGVRVFMDHLRQCNTRLREDGELRSAVAGSTLPGQIQSLLGILSTATTWVLDDNWVTLRRSAAFADVSVPAGEMVEALTKWNRISQDAARQLLTAVRADFDLAASRRYAADDDARFPPVYFGPLWPDGPPAGWPPDDQPVGPAISTVRFVQLVDALTASDFWPDLLAEFEWYGGTAYAAMRSVPFEDRADWLSALVSEVTLSGRLREFATAATLVDPGFSRLRSAVEKAVGELRPVRDYRIRIRVIGSESGWGGELRQTCTQLARKLALAGFGVIGFGTTNDLTMAEAFTAAVVALGRSPQEAMTHFFDRPDPGFEPSPGRWITSLERDLFPDLTLADAVIMIAGRKGAERWATHAIEETLPVLPLAATGGTAAIIHGRLVGNTSLACFPPLDQADLSRLGGPLPDALVALMSLLERLFPTPEVRP